MYLIINASVNLGPTLPNTYTADSFNVRDVLISVTGEASSLYSISKPLEKFYIVRTNLTADDINRRNPLQGTVYFKSNQRVLSWVRSFR